MSLHFPIRVPSELLEELGAFTGHFWSDSLALEPPICKAIRSYIASQPAQSQAQPQPTAPSDPQCEAACRRVSGRAEGVHHALAGG